MIINTKFLKSSIVNLPTIPGDAFTRRTLNYKLRDLTSSKYLPSLHQLPFFILVLNNANA